MQTRSTPFRAASWTLPGTPLCGDLQTIFAVRDNGPFPADEMHFAAVGRGNDTGRLAIHMNQPVFGGSQPLASGSQQSLDGSQLSSNGSQSAEPSKGNVLLLHGITGCHAAPYMKRFAKRFVGDGYRSFRIDARGCGVLRQDATTITHAGRSDDVAAAIDHIAERYRGPIHVIGMSLGGNQALRMAGRLADTVSPPRWIDRLKSVAAIAPPIDLAACAANMQRLRNRVYNRYFIKSLLRRMPPAIAESKIVSSVRSGRLPRTLWDFDDRITAPLAGYCGADEYYRDCSSRDLVATINVRTLVIAAQDDPIVPIESLEKQFVSSSPKLECLLTPHGGHAGFIGPRQTSWLEDRLSDWVGGKMFVRSSI